MREALYAAVAARVRALMPETFLYLCMEPRRVWRKALGATWTTPEQVELALAQSLHRRFGLAPCEPRPDAYRES